MRRILEDAGFRVPFRDLEGDAVAAATAIEDSLRQQFGTSEIEALDFLRPVFIRNKGAYLVGRARHADDCLPVVFAILNGEDGLTVDAVVRSENEISIIWSFARWYFHADLASPRQVIGFLHSILPRKRISELYLSLGYNKHGKTEFYRDLTGYAAATDESFVVAPGQRGLVMSVFTLPSYEFVFKVIRDTFPASKATTRQRVMERYRQVMVHDRVGRLVDFQEFEHLKFPRAQFAPELLDELLDEASLSVGIEGDDVIIRHLYVGRRVTPLDVFLRPRPRTNARPRSSTGAAPSRSSPPPTSSPATCWRRTSASPATAASSSTTTTSCARSTTASSASSRASRSDDDEMPARAVVLGARRRRLPRGARALPRHRRAPPPRLPPPSRRAVRGRLLAQHAGAQPRG